MNKSTKLSGTDQTNSPESHSLTLFKLSEFNRKQVEE